MKKYLILALVSTLALTSCGQKEEKKTDTTTWTKTETNTTVKTGTTETPKTSTSSTDTKTATWSADATAKTSTTATTGITEENGVSIFKNTEKWYEISFKKADGLDGQVGFQNTEIFIADMKKWNSVSVLSEDYSRAPGIADAEKYFEESVKNLKAALKEQWISEIKREDVTINWTKWIKATYSMSTQGSKLNFEQYFFDNGKKQAFIVTKTVVWDNDDARLTSVVNSFKFIK